MKRLFYIFIVLFFFNNNIIFAQWAPLSSGVSVSLTSSFFTGVDTGYVVGASGVILKTVNGGSNWVTQSSGTSRGLYSVFFTDDTTGYASGGYCTVLRTTDGGQNWVSRNTGTTSTYFYTSYFTDNNTGYVGGDFGQMYKTTDGGLNWTPLTIGTSQTIRSIFFTDANTGYAACGSGTSGVIIKTVNGGTNWTTQYTNSTFYLNAVCFLPQNPSTGFAVGDLNGNARILKTTNYGTSWVTQAPGTMEGLKSVYFYNSNIGYLLGINGKIYKTTNGGSSWITLTNGLGSIMNTVSFTSESIGYVAGNNGKIFKTTNGGLEPPIITMQPVIQLKPYGSNATFRVAATGTSPLTFQWKKGDVDIPLATDSVLTISNIDFDDQGYYSCKVGNAADTLLSDSAELFIGSNYEIAGDSVELKVINASGSIQWQSTEDTLAAWNDISGATSNPYTFISSQTTSHKKYYRAKLIDPLCLSQSPFYSTIIRNKIFDNASSVPNNIKNNGCKIFYTDGSDNGLMAPPQDQGDMLLWGCTGSSVADAWNDEDGELSTASIVQTCSERPIAASVCDTLTTNGYDDWFLPAINQLGTLFQQGASVGGFVASYYWSATEISTDNAWCKIYGGSQYSHSKGYASNVRCIRKFYATDIYKAKCTAYAYSQPITLNISSQPVMAIKKIGETAKFVVLATGTGPISYQWKKNDTIMANQNDSVLTISNVNFSNEGSYTCVISNLCRTLVSNSVKLYVGDNIEVVGDTVQIKIHNFTGSIQWQSSEDSITWTDVPNAFDSVYTFISTSTSSGRKCYRAKITDTLCPLVTPYYSSIIRHVIFANINLVPIGAPVNGGILFNKNGGNNWHISSRQDIDGGAIWGCMGTNITGATSASNGLDNTNAILTGCAARPIAASLCSDLVESGFNDWYLPANDQLDSLYKQRIFVGGFSYIYWNSTQLSNDNGWNLNFDDGTQSPYYPKSFTLGVRCIRSFPTTPSYKTVTHIDITNQPASVRIIQQPQMQIKHAGDNAMFSIICSGNIPISYQWKKNGIDLPGKTDSLLVIENITPADEGFYSCQASNLCRSIVSDSAELMLVNNVEIVGDTVQLYVNNAIGNIQWQQSDDNITWTNITNATDSICTMISAMTSTGKRYYRAEVKAPQCDLPNHFYSSLIIHKIFTNIGNVPLGTKVHGGILYLKENSNTLFLAAEKDETFGIEWGCMSTHIAGATSNTDGAANTSAIIASCSSRPIAASACADLSVDGANDWFLPAKDQLNLLWLNRKNIGRFIEPCCSYYYLSSTEYNADYAWAQYFDEGNITYYQQDFYKSAHIASTRCIRQTSSTENSKKVIDTSFVENQPLAVDFDLQPMDKIMCMGVNAELAVSIDGPSPYEFQWQKNDIDIPNATDSILALNSVSINEEGYYRCKLSNTCRVIYSDSVQIKVVTVTADAGNDKFICAGNSTVLDGFAQTNHSELGPLTYTWSPQQSLSQTDTLTPTANPYQSINYTLTVNDSIGCSSSSQVNVDVIYININYMPNKDKTIMCGQSVQLDSIHTNYTGSGTLTYHWSPGTGLNNDTIPNPMAEPDQTTTYTVMVTTPSGCTTDEDITVTVNQYEVDAGFDINITCGEKYQLSALSKMKTVSFNYFSYIYFTTPDTGFAITTNQVYKTTDGGITWNTVSSFFTQALKAIHFADNLNGYVVGNSGTVLKCTDGTNFISSPSLGGSINDVFFTHADTGYVVCNNGLIFKTINGGTNWTSLNSGTSNKLYAVVFPNDSTGYAVGLNGTILKTSDRGLTWVSQQSGVTNLLNDVSFTDADNGYIIGYGTGSGSIILKTQDGGNTWSVLPKTVPGEKILFTDSNTGFAAGNAGVNGAFSKTINGGQTWLTQIYNNVNTFKCISIPDTAHIYTISNDKLMQMVGAPDSYQWSPALSLDDSTSASPLASTITTTTYTILAHFGSCVASDTVTINVNPLTVDAGENYIYDSTNVCGTYYQLDSVVTNLTNATNLTYSWSPSAGLNTDTIPNPIVRLDTTNTYTVTVSNPEGCSANDNVNIIVFPIIPDAGTDKQIICGELAQLDFVISNYTGTLTYDWSPADGLSDTTIANPISSKTNMVYTVTITNDAGCTGTDNVAVNLIPMQKPSICIVGVDSNNKNIIVWEKPLLTAGIDSFYVFRETNVTGIFERIAAVAKDSLSVYVDVTSQPHVMSNRYKISTRDTCGQETDQSDYHKTMHLTINQGMGSTWNLIWEAYEGFTISSYNIYRGNHPESLQLIGTMAGVNTQYSDVNAPSGFVYYQVEIIGNNCNPLKSINYSRSNIATNDPNSIFHAAFNENIFKIYPNPTNNKFYINPISQIESVNVYNTLGQLIKTQSHYFENGIDLSTLSKGLYFIEIQANNNKFYSRIVKD